MAYKVYARKGVSRKTQLPKAVRFLNEQVGSKVYKRVKKKSQADVFVRAKLSGRYEQGVATHTGDYPRSGQNPPGDRGPVGEGAVTSDWRATANIAQEARAIEKAGSVPLTINKTSHARARRPGAKRTAVLSPLARGSTAEVTAHELGHIAGLGHHYKNPSPNYMDHTSSTFTKKEKKVVKKGLKSKQQSSSPPQVKRGEKF